MTATFENRTPAQVKRLHDAEQEGKLAGAEYRCLVDDMTWDPDNWRRLLEQIQVNPYEPGACEVNVPEAERAALHKRWSTAFDQGAHAQEAENRRKEATA